jgi:hypothetical protein
MLAAITPPLTYLLECAENTLHELELGALDLHAQCVKRAKSELEQAVAHREAAGSVSLADKQPRRDD